MPEGRRVIIQSASTFPYVTHTSTFPFLLFQRREATLLLATLLSPKSLYVPLSPLLLLSGGLGLVRGDVDADCVEKPFGGFYSSTSAFFGGRRI